MKQSIPKLFLSFVLVVAPFTMLTGAAMTSTTSATTMLLSENPRVSLEYAVITPESNINGDTLSQEAIDAGGVLEVRLDYEGDGWVSVGFSETGAMLGSEAVIGIPVDNDNATAISAVVPEKRRLNGYSPDALERMSDEQQTLMDATVEQQDGITTLKFGKLLKENDEFLLDISSSGVLTNLIWAVGSTKTLGYHRSRGSISLSLYDAIVPSSVQEEVVQEGQEEGTKNTTATAALVELGENQESPISLTIAPSTVIEEEEEEATNAPTRIAEEEEQNEEVLKQEEESEDHSGSALLVVSEDPMVSIEYTVLTSDSGADLPLEAAVAGGVLHVRFVYEGEGWIAFGISQGGQMIGSETIIGIPSSTGNVTVPEKYTLKAYAVDGIERMPDEKQTLMDAVMIQEDGITTMSFRKLLVEEGEIPLSIGEDNHFVWAVGSQNVLGYHSVRSNYVASLEVCVDSSCGSGVRLGSTKIPNQGMWKAHGTFATLAWGICAPLAIASSLIRSLITIPGLWFKIHLYLNMMCVLFTLILFVVAISATGNVGTEHFVGTHQKIGLSVLVISLFQVVMGVSRPHAPRTVPHNNDRDGDHDDGKYKDDEVETNNSTDNPPTPLVVTPARRLFEIGHRVVGVTLIVLSFHNINSGMELYGMRYNNGEDPSSIFWIWIGILLGSTSFLIIYSRYSATPNSDTETLSVNIDANKDSVSVISV